MDTDSAAVIWDLARASARPGRPSSPTMPPLPPLLALSHGEAHDGAVAGRGALNVPDLSQEGTCIIIDWDANFVPWGLGERERAVGFWLFFRW